MMSVMNQSNQIYKHSGNSQEQTEDVGNDGPLADLVRNIESIVNRTKHNKNITNLNLQ